MHILGWILGGYYAAGIAVGSYAYYLVLQEEYVQIPKPSDVEMMPIQMKLKDNPIR